MLTTTLALGVLAMFSQTRLSERALADIAVIGVPRGITDQPNTVARDDQRGRLSFVFHTSYFWASFGSGTAYKQLLVVSVMSPDASDAEYAQYPSYWPILYDGQSTSRTMKIGSGTLTIVEGTYAQNALKEPAFKLFYSDRARRLNLAWHGVKKEIALEDAIDAVGKMAASFRIVRDPATTFADLRDRPRREEHELRRRRALAAETLTREGFGPLEPGKPVVRNGIYGEWMTEPEIRYQLLVPLGRLRVDPDVGPAMRPRPIGNNPAAASLRGTIGWREHLDGQWTMSNDENDYMPMEGIAAKLAADNDDPTFMTFYYSATVRVDHMEDDARLNNLKWFLDTVTEAKRLWAEGKLIKNGTPVRD